MIVSLTLFVGLAAPHAVVKHGPTAMHTAPLKTPPSPKLAPKKDELKKPSDQHPAEPKKDASKVEPKKDAPKAELKKEEPKKAEGKKEPPKPCFRFPVTVTHGLEEDTFPLTMCDGTVAPGAVDRLSILARPESAQRPKASIAELAKIQGDFVAPGIKRVDGRLPRAMQSVLDHFDKFGVARKVHLVSGYRPASAGSFHATAQALDLHIDGLANEQIVSFCKTLSDVGCGYYPNSTFVHIDVRPSGTGHVAWVDMSGPGQLPFYVPRWPLGDFDDDPRTAIQKVEKKSEEPAEPSQM